MEGWNGWSLKDGMDGGVDWKEGWNRKKGRLNGSRDCYWAITVIVGVGNSRLHSTNYWNLEYLSFNTV